MKKINIIKVNGKNLIKVTSDLAKEIWNEHYVPIIGQDQVDYMVNNFQSLKAITDQINQGYSYYLIKEKDDFIGYIGFEFQDTALFLSKFYIKSSSRGKGVGKQTIDFLINLAKENKKDKITLTVNKNNKNSITAYEKLGFKIVENLVTDIGNGFFMDDYKLIKEIAR